MTPGSTVMAARLFEILPEHPILTIATAVLSNVIPYGLDQVILQRIARARFAFLMSLLPVTATTRAFNLRRWKPANCNRLLPVSPTRINGSGERPASSRSTSAAAAPRSAAS